MYAGKKTRENADTWKTKENPLEMISSHFSACANKSDDVNPSRPDYIGIKSNEQRIYQPSFEFGDWLWCINLNFDTLGRTIYWHLLSYWDTHNIIL